MPRHLITRDLRASPRRSVTVLAEQVRRYLGVTLEEQRSWPNADVAFKAWRTALERVGVFVFKRPFKQQEVSAFCLHDDEFPLIMINNGTSFTRQIFSLFHELAHLLYGVGGITTEDQSYIDNLGGTDASSRSPATVSRRSSWSHALDFLHSVSAETSIFRKQWPRWQSRTMSAGK